MFYIVHSFSVRWRLLKAEQETNSVLAFITGLGLINL